MGRALLTWLLLTALAGCGSVYINQRDRQGSFALERSFHSPHDAAATYSLLFNMLEECLGTYGYRVAGDGGHEISVESGTGMPRTFFLVDAVLLRVQVEPGEPSGSEVTVFERDRHSNTFVRAAEQRVVSDFTGCRA